LTIPARGFCAGPLSWSDKVGQVRVAGNSARITSA